MAERDRSELPQREFLRRPSACAGAAAAGLLLPEAFAGDLIIATPASRLRRAKRTRVPSGKPE